MTKQVGRKDKTLISEFKNSILKPQIYKKRQSNLCFFLFVFPFFSHEGCKAGRGQAPPGNSYGFMDRNLAASGQILDYLNVKKYASYVFVVFVNL